METLKTFEQGQHFDELHQDHNTWIQELEFCKLEISFFQQMLENFARMQKDGSQNAVIEQFQNKLILQREQVDLLMHDVKEQETKLQDFIKAHEKNIEFVTFKDHTNWRNKMSIYRKLYAEMKQAFYQGISLK
jgi:hypothetical protein